MIDAPPSAAHEPASDSAIPLVVLVTLGLLLALAFVQLRAPYLALSTRARCVGKHRSGFDILPRGDDLSQLTGRDAVPFDDEIDGLARQH